MGGNNLVSEFAKSRKGNFAMMFAFATLPIIASVGMLIEYNNISRTQHELQAAVDATALMVAKDFNKTGAVMQSQEIEDFIKANFGGKLTMVNANQVDGEMLITAKADTDAIFSDMFGLSFTQNANATVPLAGKGGAAEIALVLDSTGSMSLDNKMVDLKKVAKEFIADVYSKSTPGEGTRISIVPFAKYVNVGLSKRNESWLNVPPDGVKTYCYMKSDPLDPSSCVDETRVNREGQTYTAQVCNGYGPEYEQCDTYDSEWRGCVGSRPYPLNTQDAAYSDRVPGLPDAWCPSAITPLTDTQSTLDAAIDGLWASGETYIGTGVMWGLRTLSPDAPFDEATSASASMAKVLIVMTDGDNTVGPWATGDGWHSNYDTTNADDQTLLACAAARNAGLKVYTISFGTTVSTAGKNVMRDCATTPQHFFDASNAAKLKDAFESIAGDIYRLKLSS